MVDMQQQCIWEVNSMCCDAHANSKVYKKLDSLSSQLLLGPAG